MENVEKARLLFYIETKDEERLGKISARLQLDFSPAEQTIPAGNGSWYVSREACYLEEFPALVKHVLRLEQLFAKDGAVRILPAYLTKNQFVCAAEPSDPVGLYIAPGVNAKILGLREQTTGKLQPFGEIGNLSCVSPELLDVISRVTPV